MLDRQGSFAYSIDAQCSLATARDLLSDITRQGELHPLIVNVQELTPTTGALRSFAITDRLARGPVRFHFTYQADILSVSDTQIVTVARQKPRTKLRNTVHLSELGNGSVHIDVTVELSAPRMLYGFALRTGRAAHLELATRMKAVLERDG